MLRKSLLSGFAFGFTMFSTFGWNGAVPDSIAQTYGAPQQVSQTQSIWYSMGHSDRVIVDRLAADFYERSLRYSQTQTIENNTARAYAGATAPNRANFRAERRQQWHQMNGNQQQAMRNVKRPVFAHLSELQKWPFRDHALHQLGAAGAIQGGQNHQGYRPGI